MDLDHEKTLKVDVILERDPRYRAEAYEFVLAALSHTLERRGRHGHVTASELMAGIREFGLEQFGPLTRTVFHHWGIRQSGQFGDIVFNLIDVDLLGKRPEDKREDFDAASFDLDSLVPDRGP